MKRTVRLKESELKHMIAESVKRVINERLLTEADSRLKPVGRIIEQAFSQYFDPNGTVSGSEYYVNGNPNTTWKQYLLYNLRRTFRLMQNSDVKYLPIVARLAYSDEVQFDMTNDNDMQVRTLQRIVDQMKKDDAFFQEVKANPNITFGQLAERFKKQFDQEDAADTDMIAETVKRVLRENFYGL